MRTIRELACANRGLMLCTTIRGLLANPWIVHAQSTDSDNPQIGLRNPWNVDARAQSTDSFGQSADWSAQSVECRRPERKVRIRWDNLRIALLNQVSDHYTCVPQPESFCSQDDRALVSECVEGYHKNPPQMLFTKSFQAVWCHLHPILVQKSMRELQRLLYIP